MITAVPAAGMARKRSYHLQPRCWNEHCWFNFSGEFQTALLNWLLLKPLPTVEKCRPPKPRVKAKSSLSERNYFLTMHYQAGVNFESFTEEKFRDILLTGTGRRDRRLNRDSPGQTYGRSSLNQNVKPKSNFRFIGERPFAIPCFHQKCCPPKRCRPGALPPTPLPSRAPAQKWEAKYSIFWNSVYLG